MTRLLLDTHYIIFLVADPERLRPVEHDLLEHADAPLLVSAVSIWEIRIKWEALNRFGQRKGPVSPQTALDILKGRTDRFQLVPLRAEQPALPALNPPLPHGDPFDEMLLLQAEAEGARLLSRDKHLAGHPLVLTV
ncbi:MAG: type II toxin-antitoxin system VapC family toxin [Oceanicaulis sp.]